MIQLVGSLFFALAAGLAAGGLAATAAQMLTGLAPGFFPPYVRRSRFLTSLATTALIGPYMLFNEALAAHAEERIAAPALVTSALFALGWALASGIVLVFLAGQLAS